MAKVRECTSGINGSTKYSSCHEAVASRSNDSMGDLSPSTKNASRAIPSFSGIPPRYHNAEENSAVLQAHQSETSRFDTNYSNVPQNPSVAEPAREHLCQEIHSSDQNLSGRLSEDVFAIYRDLAELVELPPLDPPEVDGLNSESVGIVHSSSPLKMADYCVCSSDFWNGILVIEEVIKEMSPEIRHSPLSSSPRKSISTDTDYSYLSQESYGASNLRFANLGRFLDPSFTRNVMQYNMHPFPANTAANSSEVVQFVNYANDLPSPILDDTLPGSSRFAGISSIHTQGKALRPSSDQVHMDAKTRKLIISKQLTLTDVRHKSGGAIYLPKKDFTTHFPNFLEKEDVPMEFYDLDLHRHWAMTFTFESRQGTRTRRPERKYVLQNTSELRKAHYGLREGNWLHIYKTGSKSDARYALRVSKLSPGDLN